MVDVDTAHRVMRNAHIAVGFVGLALFWVPVFATKGGRLHIRCGRAFVWCAYFVGVTGLAASVWGLAAPASFFGDPEVRQISERALPYMLERARFLFSVTCFLALATLAGTYFGVRVVRTRRDHGRLPGGLLYLLEGAFAVWSSWLLAFGLYNLITCYAGQHLLPARAAGKYWVPVMLGAVGVYTVFDELRYVLRPRPTPMAWWYRHMESMLGAGVAFHTAFAVFGSARLLKLRLDGPWQLLPWLIPAAVGIPAIVIWVRYYERKFGEAGQPSSSATGMVTPGSDGTSSVSP